MKLKKSNFKVENGSGHELERGSGPEANSRHLNRPIQPIFLWLIGESRPYRTNIFVYCQSIETDVQVSRKTFFLYRKLSVVLAGFATRKRGFLSLFFLLFGKNPRSCAIVAWPPITLSRYQSNVTELRVMKPSKLRPKALIIKLQLRKPCDPNTNLVFAIRNFGCQSIKFCGWLFVCRFFFQNSEA